MYVAEYISGDRIHLKTAPDESERSHGCTVGCALVIGLPWAIGVLTWHLLDNSIDWKYVFTSVIPMAASIVGWVLRPERDVLELEVDRTEKRISWKEFDWQGKQRTARRSFSDLKGVKIKYHRTELVEVRARGTVTLELLPKKELEKKLSVRLNVDWLCADDDFLDLSHRVATILGFDRFCTTKPESKSSDWAVEYSPGAKDAVPVLADRQPEYGRVFLRKESLPPSSDKVFFRLEDAEVQVGPSSLWACTLACSLLLVGATIGVAYLFTRPSWLSTALHVGLATAGSAIAATGLFGLYWVLSDLRRGYILDRERRQIIFTGRRRPEPLPFSSVEELILWGQAYLKTKVGAIELKTLGVVTKSGPEFILAAQRLAELIGVPRYSFVHPALPISRELDA